MTQVSDRQIRELFVRTMRDSRSSLTEGMDCYEACAFVGKMVNKSALEVGLITGFDLMFDGWRRYVDHV